MIVKISDEFVLEAANYSKLSRAHTSDYHDFHEGGLNAKQKKMFEGKIGEKGIKQFFIDNKIIFEEDRSSHTDADEYDFIISKDDKKYFVDVKTRTKKFHTRTLEMVKQFHSKKIDIYISVFLMRDNSNFQIKILGWCNKKDIIKINRIENNGYLDNYVLYDKELKDINQLINYL